jgi:restriction system protein
VVLIPGIHGQQSRKTREEIPMAIPDYQSLMLPLLLLFKDKKEHHVRETLEILAKEFNLSEDDRKELLPSGVDFVLHNRIGWARTYLRKAGLLEPVKRGIHRITDRGLNILKQNPPEINVKFLKQFPEFIEFQTVRTKTESDKDSEVEKTKTPEELLESAYQDLNDQLASDLLKQIKSIAPALFERIVIKLLVAMGYGGTLKDAGEAIGKAGDEGIDGIIKEDRLGLDAIYIQAKRWENTVGRPEIQKFAGALQGQRARKGIFITTSDFSKEAQEYTSRIDTKIVLIDGKQLAKLMIDYNVGVAAVSNYQLKKIDSDFFSEEELP